MRVSAVASSFSYKALSCPALERKVPLLVSLYEAVDAHDEAERALAAAEERENQLRAELERLKQMTGPEQARMGRRQACCGHHLSTRWSDQPGVGGARR